MVYVCACFYHIIFIFLLQANHGGVKGKIPTSLGGEDSENQDEDVIMATPPNQGEEAEVKKQTNKQKRMARTQHLVPKYFLRSSGWLMPLELDYLLLLNDGVATLKVVSPFCRPTNI